MLTISSSESYKSLSPISGLTLPKLSVITGANGSGKTQLLQGLANESITASVDGATITKHGIRYVTQLKPQFAMRLDVHYITESVSQLAEWRSMQSRAHESRRDPPPQQQQKLKQLEEKFSRIAELSRCDLDALSHPVVRAYWLAVQGASGDAFNLPFASICKQYLEQENYQHWIRFAVSMGRTDVPSHDDVDLSLRPSSTTPPWIVVNKALERVIPFALAGDHLRPEDLDRPLNLWLEKKGHPARIRPEELSSGEQLMIATAMSLYAADQHEHRLPRVLLLDEVDAALHPAWVKRFFTLLKDGLCETHGVHVILATHSPSVVALAPAESVFVMGADGAGPQRASKDHAIGMLTDGVPSLRIQHEHRRQVFVEGDFDAEVYESVYQVLRERLDPEVSLGFVSQGSSISGGCDHVREIVKLLAERGSPTVRGVIDYDAKNESDGLILVIGESERYSIENFLLDPLLLAYAICRLDPNLGDATFGVQSIRSFVPPGETSLRSAYLARLQDVAVRATRRVWEFVRPVLQAKFDIAELREVRYCGDGITVQLPAWYLDCRGHDLGSAVIKAFPKLHAAHARAKRRGETSEEVSVVEMYVANHVMREIPELIPHAFLVLFRDLQNVASVGSALRADKVLRSSGD